MSSRLASKVLQHIRKLAAAEPLDTGLDQQLLERFVTQHDEAAFAGLVERHGPLVLSVCQRVLRHTPDAEDACQAAFLVLARRAASIRKRTCLASWLHGVAFRVAAKLKANLARRHAPERPLIDEPHAHGTEDVTWRELLAVLDEELRQLPEKYQAPLILCYLEGRTRDEAAQRLGWSLGTLRGRLERGRERLRARLTRRGLTLSTALLATLLSQSGALAGVPTRLVVSTVKAATWVAAGQAVPPAVISAQVAALTDGVLKTMSMTKLKVIVAVLLAACGIGSGAGALAYLAPAAGRPEGEKELSRATPLAETDKPVEDKDKLQGTWTVVAHDTLGRPANKDFLTRKHQWVFKGGEVVIRDKDGVSRQGTYGLDPTRSPKSLDVALKEPGSRPGPRAVVPDLEVLVGIYVLDGDSLKVCYNGNPLDPRQERPTEFVSKADPATGLVVFRRERPAQDEGKGGALRPKDSPLEVRLVAKKDSYTLDLGGKAPAEFIRHVREEEGKVLDHPAGLPPAVAVDLVLELRNTGKDEVVLTLGGDDSTLTLELKGPGAVSAVSQTAFTEKPIPGVPVTIAPGKSYSLPIQRLSYGRRGVEYRAYWTQPGDYTLTARLMTTEFREPFVSAPVKLKVEGR